MSRNNVGIKIIVIACFVLLLWIGCASASTLVVSRTSPACTSGDEYFTSIQAAVDRAQEGDEIVVCLGTYKENIEVDKSVSIRTYGGDTIIEAKNIEDNVITVTANRVSISGFIIRNSEADGIYLDAAEGCNISGNNIYSTRIGIYLFSSSNNKISHNTVNLNNHDGIYIESSHNNYILENTANYNKQSDGIELSSSNNNDIIGNNASYNMEDGVYLLYSNNNTIRGNRAYANKEYHGIDLSASNNNKIIDNNASDNFQSGIALFNASNSNTILGNTANSNNIDGITIESSHNNSILNNTANSNNIDGIIIESSHNNSILNNTANENKQYHGIELIASNNNTIKGNTGNSNGYFGIRLNSSKNNRIVSNNASNNFQSGIALFESSNNNTIKGNTANSNKQYHGIVLSLSNNNNIMGNNASHNFQCGILFESSNNNTIKGNTANSNKQYHGIELSASNNNNIITNNVSNNFRSGIALFNESNNNSLIGNLASLNNKDEIYIVNSHNNSILNNTANWNKQYHGIELDSSNNNNIVGNNASDNFQSGIALFNASNNNTIIGNWANSNNIDGITIESSHNNSILNNTANSNKQYHGIELIASNNNNIIANNASNNSLDGMKLDRSNNNTIRGNTANSNKQYHGIELSASNNNDIKANNASNNFQEGIALNLCNNNTLIGNTANSNKRRRGILLDLSNNNKIIDNTASYNFEAGILLMNSNNNILIGNTAKSNKYGEGIYLDYSNINIVSDNTLLYNGAFGVRLDPSTDYNTITNNIIYFNSKGGIQLRESQKNNISDNIINSNIGYGVFLGGGENNNIVNNIINSNQGRGLNIQWSRNNNVLDNIIESNGEFGIFLFNSNMITISGNLIGSNYLEGININMNYNSFNNSLHHNNIINNEARDDLLKNRWYDDTLKEGNYWSDYNGTDDGSGTDKHAIAGDDIGDTNIPYPIEGYDFYPFMNRDGWLTMSVWPHYHDFGKVYQGTLINRTFTITNYGNSPLIISSLLSEQAIISYGIEFPAVIHKGQSQSFDIMLDTEQLDGFVLKNIEIVSNDHENPHKTIAIFGFVEIPASNIKISGVDYQSRVIKGQINLFNVTIENQGDFRERNVSIEIKERGNIRDNTTINIIESRENRSAILKWDTENASLGIHEIIIEVLSKDKEPLAHLAVKVSVLAPSKAKTFIVTNLGRLEGVENKLIQLSHHPSVSGIILNVENETKCTEVYKSWDNDHSSENANDVAVAIKGLIDSSLAVYKNIEYIIIVGNDEVIPFYRIQDKSLESYVGSYGLYDEKVYIESYKQLKPATTIGSAFQDNMYLTDDFYANFESEDLPEGIDGELYIPDKPIGRLVETPEEISKTIDVFSKKGDIVEPQRIFVTSYDFMNDTGGSCASVLGPLGTLTFMGRGIEEHGTYSDTAEIVNELLNESNNIVAIFQHADHYEFDIAESHDFVTSNIISNSSTDLDGSIVYTMSCHAGLNVPKDEKFNYDLAQAFMGKGVLAYVAPTGWGIGGVVTEAGHERLMHYFTKHLCEGMDAGTALMHAKQDYYAFDFDFDYIDQKVVLTSVLYGLPMYGVNVEAKTEGIMEAMSMEKPCNTFTFRPDYSEIETPVGNYSSADETLSAPGKPVLPKLIWPYTMGNKMLHGITLKNASYDLIESTNLPYEEFVVSIAGDYLQLGLTGEDWNPSKFFKVTTIGKKQYIILITGQFKKIEMVIKEGKRINRGDLRRYRELTFDLYLSSPEAEKEPPAIKINQINASFIKVNATDESGIRKIVVVYTDNKGWWGSFDIVPEVAACTLEEEIELGEGKEYFVQAVDIYGNVAVNDNDGKYYPEKAGGLGPS